MTELKPCPTCMHSCPVHSENGLHWNCTLSKEKSVMCITGIDDFYEKIPLLEGDNDAEIR